MARGKKLVYVELDRDPPPASELLRLILGPTGNLRAPTIRVGTTVLVGFNEDAYGKVFG